MRTMLIAMVKYLATDGTGYEWREPMAVFNEPCPVNMPECNVHCGCCHAMNYAEGMYPPNYPMPATIGFQRTRWSTYLFDTIKGYDGMPLFRGYSWNEWNAP